MRNLTILQKLALVVGVLSLVCVLAMLPALRGLRLAAWRMTSVLRLGELASHASRMNSSALALNRLESDIALNWSEQIVSDSQAAITGYQSQFSEHLKQAQALEDEPDRPQLDSIATAYRAYLEEVERTLQAARLPLSPEQRFVRLQEEVAHSRPRADQVIGLCRAYSDRCEQDAKNNIEQLRRSDAQFRRETLVISISGLLVGSLIAYFVAVVGIGRPLRRAIKLVSRLSRGDLEVQTPGQDRRDEFGQLARALEVFKQNARENQRLHEQEHVERERAEAALQELKAAQTQLVEAEKMASLGGLVAGVAHEVNTPLGITLTAATTLADETHRVKALADESKAKRSDVMNYLQLAVETTHLMVVHCEHAAALIASFKLLAVDQCSDAEHRPLQLRSYLEDILVTLQPQLKKTPHQVRVEGDEHLAVDTYPGAFTQIVTNLVGNSLMHAFEGEVQGEMVFRVGQDEAHVEVRYSDNGKGIRAALVPKIFDPFFTTKRGAGGSGLGLHVVHNLVVSRLKGTLRYEDAPGGGAAFVIRFPLIPPQSRPQKEPDDEH